MTQCRALCSDLQRVRFVSKLASERHSHTIFDFNHAEKSHRLIGNGNSHCASDGALVRRVVRNNKERAAVVCIDNVRRVH